MAKRKPANKVYAIVVDGKTEIWYLELLRQVEQLHNVQIKPELPKKKKLKEIYAFVLDLTNDYDKVIWILDLDTIIKEGKESKKGLKEMMGIIGKYKKTIEKKQALLIVNTPCLEEWFLMHFEYSGKYYPDCSSVERHLKEKYIPDYEKTQKMYKKKNNDIYSRLKPNLKTGLENAKKLGEFDLTNPEKAKTEMYKLFDFLGIQE
jgi:hypothetical protein